MEQFRGFVENLPDFFKPWGEEILLRYFDFEGRTDRAAFWKTVLVNVIISMALGIIGRIPLIGLLASLVAVLYSLATLIPGIALQVRRLNDIGKSWPFIFLAFIPCVGGIILIVFDCMDSQ